LVTVVDQVVPAKLPLMSSLKPDSGDADEKTL